MSIIGFTYTKINAEKSQPITGKIDISNNVTIKDVQASDVSISSEKDNALKFIFDFNGF